MADLSVNVQQVGAPLGSLALSATAKSVEFVNVNRVNTEIQSLANDGSSNVVSFLYSNTATGTFILVPAGAGLKLPVYKTQTWWFKQDISAAPTLQLTCVG